VAVPVSITAFMPSVLVIVPMVIPIIIAFGRLNDAAHRKADETEYEGAFDNSLCIYHWTLLHLRITALKD
jgi:hypothetical protein